MIFRVWRLTALPHRMVEVAVVALSLGIAQSAAAYGPADQTIFAHSERMAIQACVYKELARNIQAYQLETRSGKLADRLWKQGLKENACTNLTVNIPPPEVVTRWLKQGYYRIPVNADGSVWYGILPPDLVGK